MQLTVTGYLVRGGVAIGGETTGWQLELDVPVNFEGRTLTVLEVNHDISRFAAFANKYVEVTGSLELRQGIERESYPVLEIDTIRELG